ncbi:MAG: type III pantothenate kinase [Francisellaceae bacterium]|jgi:type III pantothenate kinase
MAKELLCIDIGNTSATLATYSQASFHMVGYFSTLDILHSTKISALYICLQKLTGSIKKIGISSVVPNATDKIKILLNHFFPNIIIIEINAFNTKLVIADNYPPQNLGRDRIACALGGLKLFPQKNLIIIDLGTATTVCSISKNKEFLGGAILPGFKTTNESLFEKAPILRKYVEHTSFDEVQSIGTSSQSCIASGLYYGHLGAIKEIIKQQQKSTKLENPLIIGTGGYCHVFAKETLFDYRAESLILEGIKGIL